MPTYPEGDAPLILKPENDEAQWQGVDYLTGSRSDAYDAGWKKGWRDAIESLKVLNLTDAAEKLEALNNGQLVHVAD